MNFSDVYLKYVYIHNVYEMPYEHPSFYFESRKFIRMNYEVLVNQFKIKVTISAMIYTL